MNIIFNLETHTSVIYVHLVDCSTTRTQRLAREYIDQYIPYFIYRSILCSNRKNIVFRYILSHFKVLQPYIGKTIVTEAVLRHHVKLFYPNIQILLTHLELSKYFVQVNHNIKPI